MRERVQLYGGTVHHGRDPDGSFRIQVRLPFTEPTRVTPETADAITVLLADDQALVRSGFRMIVDAEPDMSVVGEAVDGDDAVEKCRSARHQTWC